MPPVPAKSADVVRQRRDQDKEKLLPRPHSWAIALLCVFSLQCSTLTTFREAPFPYRKTDLSRGDLAGPYSGYVRDSEGVAIEGAAVHMCLVLDTAAKKLVCFDQKTESDGSYAFPLATSQRTGSEPSAVRGVTLFVYHPGFVGYRSDLHWDGAVRQDFTQRSNEIYLEAFPSGSSHRNHLSFLSGSKGDPWLSQTAGQEYVLAKQEEQDAAKPKPPVTPPPPPPWAEAESVLRNALAHDHFQQTAVSPTLVAVGADNSPDAASLAGLSFSGVILRPADALPEALEKKVFLLIWRTPVGKTSKIWFDRLRRGGLPVKSGDKEVTLVQKTLRGGNKKKVLALSALGHRASEGTVWQLICGTERCTKPADFKMLSSLVRDALRQRNPSEASVPAAKARKPQRSTP